MQKASWPGKNKLYNITTHFTGPELLNKYRDDDDNINKKIETDEKLNKQHENLARAIDENLNKYLNKKIDISKYKDQYTFKNNVDILNSSDKILNDYNLSYNPRSMTTEVSAKYLLNKLEKAKNIPKELFQYFDSNVRDKKKLNLEFRLHRINNIPLIPDITVDDNNVDPVQQGQGTLNNIKINEIALNRNILKIRYLNGRKLNNKLLKNDYKITKNMKEAIEFNKNIHKLSQNEKIFTMNLKNI